jgi:ATP-dependent Zn protease
MKPKKPEKNQKKSSQKIPGLPKNAQVKVIEITPKHFLIILVVAVLLWSLYKSLGSFSSEEVTYNDILLIFFFMSRMGGGGMGGPMAFIKSRANVYDPEMDEKWHLLMWHGSDEEKLILIEVVDFLKNPNEVQRPRCEDPSWYPPPMGLLELVRRFLLVL